jgi:hypothetical protein
MVGAAAMDPLLRFDAKSGLRRRLLENFKPLLSTFRLREQHGVSHTRIDPEYYDHLRQEPLVISFRDIVESGDVDYTRRELVAAAAAIFRKLFEKTEPSIVAGKPQIVLGIPLTFPDYAKKRLLEIIVEAGACHTKQPYREILQRVRFVPEPIGASLLYASECEPKRGKDIGRVLVFDSGGGTLDLALLEFQTIDGSYRPIRQLALDSRILAGKRYDECIQRFGLGQYKPSVLEWSRGTADPEAVANWRLAQAAEHIKVSLSTQREHVELSLLGAGVRAPVTRREFEDWCAPLLRETRDFIKATVGDLDSVDTVIMVGGSSLIPCVQELVREMFPGTQVIHEDPSQTSRGEGVERALTAVSRGLALYEHLVSGDEITPFAYGFWDMVHDKVVEGAPKWSSHKTQRPIVAVPAMRGSEAMTLTLVQELVDPERVLNILNVPVTETTDLAYSHVRVKTSEATLYPRIELVDPTTRRTIETFSIESLTERELSNLVTNDQHVVRWPGTSGRLIETSYPEIIALKRGDEVLCVERHAGRQIENIGRIVRIDKIENGIPYAEVGHWDVRRWRFYIKTDSHSEKPFVPVQLGDIRLASSIDRRRSRQRAAATL